MGDRGHLGGHRTDVGVEAGVAVPAAELGQSLGDLADLLGHEVVPHLTVGLGDGLGDRVVGVDGVAGVQEEVRVGLVHRAEPDQPAEIGVDPPALAAAVAGPHEALRGVPGRRGAERRDLRLAPTALLVLEGQAHGVLPARRQPAECDLGSEVGRRRRPRTSDPVPADLGDEPPGPGRAGPEDGLAGGHVTGLDARGQLESARDEAEDRRGGAGGATDDEGAGAQGAGAEQGTTRKGVPESHGSTLRTDLDRQVSVR